jgi:amino acid transporter
MPDPPTLDRRLTTLDYFALGFGACIGVGWVVLMGDWLRLAGGPLPAALGFGIAFLLLLPVGFCYAELASALPAAGGSIVYTQRAFGSPRLSFAIAWFTILAYVSICPWEAIAIGRLAADVLPGITRTGPSYTLRGFEIHLPMIGLGIVTTALVVWMNHVGARWMAVLQDAMTWVLVAAAGTLLVGGLALGQWAHLAPFSSRGPGPGAVIAGVLAIVALAPFFMAGFDAIAQGAEEAGTAIPPRSLGRAIVLALGLAACFYCLICVSAGLAMADRSGYAKAPSTIQIFERSLGSRPLAIAAVVGAVTGLLTTFNACFYAATRALYAMSRQGLLPPAFGRLHPRYRTPTVAILFVGGLSLVGPFLGKNWLLPLTSIGGIGFVVMYLGGALSAHRLHATEPDLPRPYRMPGGRLMATAGVAAALLLLAFCLWPTLPNALVWPVDHAVLLGWLELGGALWWLRRGSSSGGGHPGGRWSVRT